MNWYIAKLIFNININRGKNQSQFDEQLRLISAHNSTEAYYKAELIGKSENESFSSNIDNTVEWQFIDVAEIILLTEIKDGMELYSDTTKKENPEDFIQQVKQRASQFQSLQVQNN